VGAASMTAAQFVDENLLHELSHTFGQDHPRDNSTAFDRNIWSHCFK
jgi:hypothetical protein